MKSEYTIEVYPDIDMQSIARDLDYIIPNNLVRKERAVRPTHIKAIYGTEKGAYEYQITARGCIPNEKDGKIKIEVETIKSQSELIENIHHKLLKEHIKMIGK